MTIMKNKVIKYFISLTALVLLFIITAGISAEAAPPAIPKLTLGVGEAQSPREVALTLEILFAFTILALAPGIIMMTTAFTRIVIVFLFLERALSLQQMPPRQVTVSIALFLTFYIMAPTFKIVNSEAVQPYMNGKISFETALTKAADPMRKFMFKYTRDKDLALFLDLAKSERPKTQEDVPTHILIPAFVTSELKTAFLIGLLLFIPFIVIDMVVASTLMSMGMIMLPPVMISVPFKLLIFVMVDGWHLITYQLIMSFQ